VASGFYCTAELGVAQFPGAIGGGLPQQQEVALPHAGRLAASGQHIHRKSAGLVGQLIGAGGAHHAGAQVADAALRGAHPLIAYLGLAAKVGIALQKLHIVGKVAKGFFEVLVVPSSQKLAVEVGGTGSSGAGIGRFAARCQ
jgi:hypothetical protein